MSSLRKVVLVAEDEVLTRMVAADFLAAAGYDVLEAAHAAAALDILAASAPGIHALFTDIHMGRGLMTGLQLAHHAHGAWPWISLLVVSGLASPGVPDMPPGARFLPKPYDPGNVVAHLADMMARPISRWLTRCLVQG